MGQASIDKNSIFLQVSSACWTILECGIFVQIPDIATYTIGPLPQTYCFFQAVIRSAIAAEFLLYLDAIVVIRFIYIFCLKNPAILKDEFWLCFINWWIKCFSFIFQLTWHLNSERQPIGFYICSGQDPTGDYKKPSTARGSIEIFSFFLHIFVATKVARYKHTFSAGPPTMSEFFKTLSLNDIESRSLSSFTTSLVNFALICLTSTNVIVLNKLEPATLNQYPYMILVYYAFLVSPCLLTLFAIIFYYISHKPLTKAIKWELKEIILKLHDIFRA